MSFCTLSQKQKHPTSVELVQGEKKGRRLIWCFNRCGGALSNWHQDGRLGTHNLWAMFHDSNHHGDASAKSAGEECS